MMKGYFTYQGNVNITGSQDTIREACGAGLITDGTGWMDTLYSRNQTVHTYNE